MNFNLSLIARGRQALARLWQTPGLFGGRSDDGPAPADAIGVREPRPRGLGGRSAAVALAEPEEPRAS